MMNPRGKIENAEEEEEWKPHIANMETKVIKELAVLKELSGTHLGMDSEILKTVYTGTAQSSVQYRMSAWATAAKTHTNKLDKVYSGLSTILGTMQTTPIVEIEKAARDEVLESRTQAGGLCLTPQCAAVTGERSELTQSSHRM